MAQAVVTKQNSWSETMRNVFSILIVAALLVFPGHVSADATANLVLKRGATDWITLKSEGGVVKASSKSFAVTLTHAETGFSLISSSGSHRVKSEDGKYKIYGPRGALLLKIKITPEKIKILQKEDDPEPWSVKSKRGSGDTKVKRSETELGKVSFHPGKSLIKVKDTTGSEVCSMTATAMTASPAVCLMNGLPEESALMVFALLNAIGE
jgi:hypothetical protein